MTSKVQIYMDTLMVEALLSDGLVKNAQSGIISSIITKVKEYVGSHINPADKLGSVINILIPGALGALGFPIIGFIVEIATSWFGLDLGKILENIGSEIKSLLVGGAKATSGSVDSIVHSAFSSNAGGAPTQDDLEAAKNKPIHALSMREIQLYKASILHLMDDADLTKRAQILGTLGRFIGLKSTTVSALTKIVGWIVKVILASAGFMVADDAIHSVVGVPSHTDFSSPSATSPHKEQSISLNTPTQTVFKPNPDYTEERLNMSDRWIEPVPPSQMGDEIVQWTKDIYPDTKEVADDIKSTVGFNKAMQIIDDYNATNKLNITFMPKQFSSRKKIVDLFIDELAKKAPMTPIPNASAKPPHKTLDI